MMGCCVFVAYFLLASFPLSLQCGISTHIAIGHQAIQWFDDKRENTSYRQLILAHQDAFIAGNPYPDAMYSSLCFKGKYHSIAEDTHWTGFLNATVNYIRRKYPKPWSKETEKLVVFMLGFVSHQVADVTWHSLGINQGFLQTMDKVNFHGSFSAAHSVGDPGGDMVNTFEEDTKEVPFSLKTWYVPVHELANIYTEYYGKESIKASEIEMCTKILFLGWLGERVAGGKVFKRYASKSPFLIEALHEYFQGGLSDMAAWSGLIWHDTIDMLEHGTNFCHVPKSPLFISCNKTRTITKQKYLARRNPGAIFLPELLKKLKLSDVEARRTDQGIYLSLKESRIYALFPQFLKKRKIELSGGEKNDQIRYNHNIEDLSSQSASYSTKTSYAKLGWSLAKGNFDGTHDALVLGAPSYGTPGRSQYGRVYVVNTNKNGSLPLEALDLDTQAQTVIDGLVENGKFGTGLAVVDLNKDNVDDLAVSAPSTGANSIQYTGTVYVYYGVRGKGLSPKPDLTITAKDQYYNLGTNLMGVDIDRDGHKDLVIASPYAPVGGPQRGSVSVFLAKTPRKAGEKLSVLDADWMASGEQDFSWFGHSIELIFTNNLKPMLVVTAPTFRICAKDDCSYSTSDTQSVGRLYVYDVITGTKPSPAVTVTGHDSFMKFGTSVAFGRPNPKSSNVLAVSASTLAVKGTILKLSTTFEQCGAIYLLNVTDLLSRKGNWSIANLPIVTVFEGDRSFARFGWKLNWMDVNFDGIDDFVFSAPFRTDDVTEELKGAEKGQLYVFYGGQDFPTGQATRGCKTVEPCPGEKASLVFNSPEERARFGTSFISVHSGNSSLGNFVVSFPRSSRKAFHSGAVNVYTLKKSVS